MVHGDFLVTLVVAGLYKWHCWNNCLWTPWSDMVAPLLFHMFRVSWLSLHWLWQPLGTAPGPEDLCVAANTAREGRPGTRSAQ